MDKRLSRFSLETLASTEGKTYRHLRVVKNNQSRTVGKVVKAILTRKCYNRGKTSYSTGLSSKHSRDQWGLTAKAQEGVSGGKLLSGSVRGPKDSDLTGVLLRSGQGDQTSSGEGMKNLIRY